MAQSLQTSDFGMLTVTDQRLDSPIAPTASTPRMTAMVGWGRDLFDFSLPNDERVGGERV